MSAGGWTLVLVGAGMGALATGKNRRRRRSRRAREQSSAPLRTIGRANPEDGPARRRLELIALHVSDTSLPGKLYTVRRGDTPYKVARRALSTVGRHTASHALEYWHCVSSSQYNQGRYGTYSTSKRYPAELLVPGLGKGIRAAFVPCNEDALEAIAQGYLPRHGVDERDGTPLGIGEHYGTIWLPHVDPDALAQGEITCRTFSWADGSSTIEPDPELLALLETR